MSWVILAVGAGFMFAPGMIDPLAPVNGSTLLGLALLIWATYRLVNNR